MKKLGTLSVDKKCLALNAIFTKERDYLLQCVLSHSLLIINKLLVMLKTGMKAPDFALPDKIGHLHKLSRYQGLPIVLYFCPEDDVRSCVEEAYSFKKLWKNFLSLGVVVFGINAEVKECRNKFCATYNLPYPLLSDVQKKTIKKYYALANNGIKRMTYIIDPSGRIAKIYNSVKAKGHGEEVLSDIEAMKL